MAAALLRKVAGWGGVAVFALGVFAVGLTAIADGDVFWHLAAGRHMAEQHALLTADPFSVSALGRRWVDVHWLFQLGVYGVWRVGGLGGLVLVKAALVVAGALVLLRVIAREAGRRMLLPFAVAFVLSLLLVRHLLLVRPVVVTLLFMALHLLVLERYRRDGRPRALAWLPVMQIAWVNCQGLAPLGPALVGAYLVGAAGGRWAGRRWYPFAAESAARPAALALTLGASLAASFVSPFGAQAAAALPVELLRRITPTAANVFAREVAENVPPFVLERTAPGSFGHLSWYLGALALVFFLARRRLLLSRTLVVGALVALALMANRNVLLLYWLATPLAALDLAPSALALADRLRRVRFAGVALGVGGVAALVAVVGAAWAAAAREPSFAAPTPFHFPTESARVLAERPGGGKVFTADHQGGYVIWKLFPRYRPYLDTRLILRTPAEYGEFLDLLAHPERFDAFQARHGFAYVVLPAAFPDRYLGLAQHLAGDSAWTLLFTDGSEALWAYRSGERGVDLAARATTEAILANLEARYAADADVLAAARRQLARLELVLGHVEEARHVLAPMSATDPAALALLARCHVAVGDLAAAEALARRLLGLRSDDVEALTLLARVALTRGQRAEGLGWLRRALAADPYDSEARALLERLEQP